MLSRVSIANQSAPTIPSTVLVYTNIVADISCLKDGLELAYEQTTKDILFYILYSVILLVGSFFYKRKIKKYM